MAYLSDTVFDSGLSAITAATNLELHVCPTQPADRTATLAASLGKRDAPTITGPADGSPDGRAVTISAVADGAISADGTAGFWALIDGAELLAANNLTASQVVTSGNSFSLTAITVRIPDAI